MFGLQKFTRVPSLSTFHLTLSFVFLLARAPRVFSGPQPRPKIDASKIGEVLFMHGSQISPKVLYNQVPAGLWVDTVNKTLFTVYFAVKYVPKRSMYRCGIYFPKTKRVFIDDGDIVREYHRSQVRVILAEPGTMEWVPASNANDEALRKSWFSCGGDTPPTGRETTPCRAKHGKSLLPGFVSEARKTCVVTVNLDNEFLTKKWDFVDYLKVGDPKNWQDKAEYEYIRPSMIGRVLYDAVKRKKCKIS